jgi:hypothetical protein
MSRPTSKGGNDNLYSAMYCLCGELRTFEHYKEACVHCGGWEFTPIRPPWGCTFTAGDRKFLRGRGILAEAGR